MCAFRTKGDRALEEGWADSARHSLKCASYKKGAKARKRIAASAKGRSNTDTDNMREGTRVKDCT
jgi:hypothetical protein